MMHLQRRKGVDMHTGHRLLHLRREREIGVAGIMRVDAALQAARLRFRPIVMTSLAFILGVFPLVISTGAGSAARRSMGTGVFGGMLASTFIATIFVPMFYTWLAGRTRKRDLFPGEASQEVPHE